MSVTTQTNDRQRFIPLRVASTGICCSVGNDTASASAAIRAHLNHFRQGGFIDTTGEPINVAMLHEVPTWGQSRLQHMYRSAMTECLAGLPRSSDQLPPIILIGAERERGTRFHRGIIDLFARRRITTLAPSLAAWERPALQMHSSVQAVCLREKLHQSMSSSLA